MALFQWFWVSNLYHKMNDIKILREFAKINSCFEELKAVNKLEKVCLIYWIIGNKKAYLCDGERRRLTTFISGSYFRQNPHQL